MITCSHCRRNSQDNGIRGPGMLPICGVCAELRDSAVVGGVLARRLASLWEKNRSACSARLQWCMELSSRIAEKLQAEFDKRGEG
jgi:hypothetical protein